MLSLLVLAPAASEAQRPIPTVLAGSSFSLPRSVFVVDVSMNGRERAATRIAIEALAEMGRGPDLLLGTRGNPAMATCVNAGPCSTLVKAWLVSHERIESPDLGERFDRLFDPDLGSSLPVWETVRALERARYYPVRRFGGERSVDILVLSPALASTDKDPSWRGPDSVSLADAALDTPVGLAEFLCAFLGTECVMPAPAIQVYLGQHGFRIFVDEEGTPARVESIPIGGRLGTVADAIDVAALTPYVTGLSLEWNGGDRAVVALVGRDTSRITSEHYDVSITLDEKEISYIFDGSSLVIDLPERNAGMRTLSVSVSGGQLEAPIVDSQTHAMEWIADFGTLAPGAAPRCIPVAPEFGPVRAEPFFVSVVRRGEELCASVSIGSLSTIAEWPRWDAADGVARELRLYSEPSPVLWLILAGLLAFAALLMKRALHLALLQRRPSHIVVSRRDESGYRGASHPERVVALTSGPLSALAPELGDLDAQVTIDAVVTITFEEEFLLKRHNTAAVERRRRATLPAGATLAFGEVQVAFVDGATAARIEAREFQALPVFSAADLEGPAQDEKRGFTPVLDAVALALPVTITAGAIVGLGSEALPVVGTYAGFAAASALLLGVAYLLAARFRLRR